VLEELQLLHPLGAVHGDDEHTATEPLRTRVERERGADDRVPVRPERVVREPLRVGEAAERGTQHVAEATRALRWRSAHAGLKKFVDSTRYGGV
jgi:hypothetical protein